MPSLNRIPNNDIPDIKQPPKKTPNNLVDLNKYRELKKHIAEKTSWKLNLLKGIKALTMLTLTLLLHSSSTGKGEQEALIRSYLEIANREFIDIKELEKEVRKLEEKIKKLIINPTEKQTIEELQRQIYLLKIKINRQIWIRKFRKRENIAGGNEENEVRILDGLERLLVLMEFKADDIEFYLEERKEAEEKHKDNEISISISELKKIIEKNVFREEYFDIEQIVKKEILDELIKVLNIRLNSEYKSIKDFEKIRFFDKGHNGVILIAGEKSQILIKVPIRNIEGIKDEIKYHKIFFEKLDTWKNIQYDNIRLKYQNGEINAQEKDEELLLVDSINIPQIEGHEKILIMEKVDGKSINHLKWLSYIQEYFPKTINDLGYDLNSLTALQLNSIADTLGNKSTPGLMPKGKSDIPYIRKKQLDLFNKFLIFMGEQGYYHNDLDGNNNNVLLGEYNGVPQITLIDFGEAGAQPKGNKNDTKNIFKDFIK